ncbi:putative uncharacterized protein DDB_G0277255 [Scaptodrosophila lebanonensis]|uniref:Regulatory protein zeste n=1 Tax=Drosophila lebanonensis TaxID=7225 RepID=A0A6J2TS14_DROLE|nr:putative uncharacterized protein DDB_G0277255 [Scaptodrosophila lebanonensis]XP_030379426.1 putative uncharacterized protein DDB_G0277255 [Scaptodrosophila lebanonensis]
MEKTPRYTQRERNMVLGYAAQYKDVIENKRTDAESNRKKDEVWLQIAKDFNSHVYHQRSAKQLRQLYKNMKLLLKKDLCGEDKGNRSFMDLLNTLSQQESVAQYIAEQMSPDGAGASGGGGSAYAVGGLAGTNGRQSHDYDDSKMYDALEDEVVLVKSETFSDHEQSDNGMDCGDDDDDDDCLSSKAPEVCLEVDEDVLYATDLRQLQQQNSSQSGNNMNANSLGPTQNGCESSSGVGGNSNNNGSATIGPRAASSPVCSTKTSVSSTGSYLSGAAPKPEVTIPNIRVGAFANINNVQQNGNAKNNNNSVSGGVGATSAQPALSPSAHSNGAVSANGNGNGSGLNSRFLPPTAEQVQQHLLLNGLGLSAVHPPHHTLQSAINAATSGANSARLTASTLQLPRLQRGGGGHTNASSTAATVNGLPLILNGHQGNKEREPKTHSNGNAGNYSGFNGNANISGNTSGGPGSGNSTRGQHNEYMMTLSIEKRKREIELLNAQIEYWQTLTKKLDGQAGHFPTPSCACHFPGSAGSGGTGVLQTQASGS